MPSGKVTCAAAVLGVAIALTGCSGSADKAGGDRPAKPTVLTLANYGSGPNELAPFAAEVSRRSHGTLRIAFENFWRDGQPNLESKLIRDVVAGRAAMGWAGSRAWDAFGITSFDALHLPFLIDSDRLEQAVLEGPLPAQMLPALHRLGLVGVGILPGELRWVVGVRKPLVRVGDFSGLRFGTTPARAAHDTMSLLGAKPISFLRLDSVRGFGGFDFPITSFEANHYDLQARFITTNLAFWPRPIVIFVNETVYRRLTPSQRAVLRSAAQQAMPGVVETAHGLEQKAMAALCLRGHTRFVQVSARDLARFRAVTKRVRTSVDETTRRYERAVERIKRRVAAPPQRAPGCPPSGSTVGAIPNGTYVSTMTAADGRRARIPAADPFYRVLPIRHRLVVRGRSFVLYDGFPDGHTKVSLEGTYTAYRGKVVFSTTTETLLPISWSVSGRDLRFFDLPFHGSGYYGAMFSPPWKRTR